MVQVFNILNLFRGHKVVFLKIKQVSKFVGFITVSMFFSQMVNAGKIVVFDHQEAILRTEVAQAAVKGVTESAEFKQLTQQGEALKSDLEALKKEYDTEGLTWSDEIKAQKNSEAENIQKSLQLAAKKAQTMQAAAVTGVAGDIQQKLEKILEELIAAEKIDIILQKQVAYIAVPEADITKKVTEALNKELAAAKK